MRARVLTFVRTIRLDILRASIILRALREAGVVLTFVRTVAPSIVTIRRADDENYAMVLATAHTMMSRLVTALGSFIPVIPAVTGASS